MKDDDDVPAPAAHDDSDQRGHDDHTDTLVTSPLSPVLASFMKVTEDKYHYANALRYLIVFKNILCINRFI